MSDNLIQVYKWWFSRDSDAGYVIDKIVFIDYWLKKLYEETR